MMHIEIPSVFLDILDGSLDGGVPCRPIQRNRPQHANNCFGTGASPAGGRRARGQRHFRQPEGCYVNSQQQLEHPLGFNLGKWLETLQTAANGQKASAGAATADTSAKTGKTGNANSQQNTAHPLGNLGNWLEALQKVANGQEVTPAAAASTKIGKSAQTTTTDVFRQRFDLKSFTPAEITVKMDGSTLVVQGKHEATEEGGTYESREYLKKVPVPENVLVEQMICQLDETDGHLLIEAPLKKVQEEKTNVRRISIQFVPQKEATADTVQDKEVTLD